MPRLVLNEPFPTPGSAITIDAGLPVGRHRFRLEVVGATGRLSAPDEAIVEVQRLVIPPIQPVSPVPPPVEDRVPGPTPVGPTPIAGPARPEE